MTTAPHPYYIRRTDVERALHLMGGVTHPDSISENHTGRDGLPAAGVVIGAADAFAFVGTLTAVIAETGNMTLAVEVAQRARVLEQGLDAVVYFRNVGLA